MTIDLNDFWKTQLNVFSEQYKRILINDNNSLLIIQINLEKAC